MKASNVIGLALVPLVLSGTASAQEGGNGAAILVDSRVRVLAPGVAAGRMKGRVTAADERTITVAVDDAMSVRIPRQAISQLEVSTGRKRPWLKGLVVGAVAGAAFWYSTYQETDCAAYQVCSRAQAVGQGALGGAGIGALIGVLRRVDDWHGIPLQGVRVGVAPARDGAAVSVSVPF